MNPNYTDYSYTDLSHINQSAGQDMMEDINACMELIRKNIEYEHYMNHADRKDRELYNELYELICEIVCAPQNGKG